MGQTTYTYTHSGDALTGVVPNLSLTHTVTCGENLTIDYTLTSGSAYSELQYEDEDSNWPEVETDPETVSISSTELNLRVYVIDLQAGETVTLNIESITEPEPLSFTLSPEIVFCPANSGEITVTVTGGTPDYTVNVSGTEKIGAGSSFTFSGLADGDYTVSVSDASACPDPNDQTYTVDIDTEAPNGCDFPDDFTMLIDNYVDLDSTFSSIIEEDTYTNDGSPDTLVYEYDATDFNKLYFDFEVTQTGTGWNTSDDYIQFWVDYTDDEDINGDVLYESTGSYTIPPNDSLLLPAIADGRSNLLLYIIYETGDNDKSYTISDVTLVGNSMTETIETSTSIEPSNCTDNYTEGGDIRITHVDGIINWVCNEPGNQEFWFERTFTVADECGNETDPYVQKIGVGEKPKIDEPRDTILDYCHYASIDFPVPGYTDNSTGCGKTVDFKYVLRDKTHNEFIDEGTEFTGATTAITFPPSEANDTTFVITWIATDEAGLQDSVKQYVTILKPITVTLNPYKPDFCSGEEVSFEFTIEGGTGSYGTVQETDITPSETLSVSGSSYTFTTSSLELDGTKNITINVTDTNVSDYGTGNYEVIGGCSEQIIFKNGDDFTIHQNISTNPLNRVDQ